MMKQLVRAWPILLAVAALTLAAAAPVRAAERREVHRAQAGEPAPAGEAGENVISLKLAGLELLVPDAEPVGAGAIGESEVEPTRVLRRVGVSIGLERVLVPGWLDIELTVLLAPGAGGLTLPVDLVLKKPFELSTAIEAFVGLGVATEWLEAGERVTAYGAASQLGAYYWLDPRVGLALEGEYNLLLRPETEHEIVLASGAAVRF